MGESLDEAGIARRVPEKVSVADLGVEPLEVGRWKRARNPDLAPDEPEAMAQLKELAAMAESSDLAVAAWASAAWARESGRTIGHVEARLAEALAHRPALRVGEGMDAGAYAAWRFEAESGLTAARALLGMTESQGLGDLVHRADAVLADDDVTFSRQAAQDHAAAWEARWRVLEGRADAAGLSVHDLRRAAGAVEGARQILDDPALEQDRRERIATTVAAFDARIRARRLAETWLAAWDERNPSDAAAIGDARGLAADPALPAALKSRLALAIDRHERLAQAASPTAAAGTAEPSVDDARPVEPVTRERAPEETATPPQPVVEDEAERETRREQARKAANQARCRADDVHRQLEDWEAHLAGSNLESVIAQASGAAQDPDLGTLDRRRLEEATALARRRLEAHEAYLGWQEACRVHADTTASRGAHVVDDPGWRELVVRAGRLAKNPVSSGTARRTVAEWLAATESLTETRVTFLERRLAWERLETTAEVEGKNPFDHPETGDVVAWLRENLESAGITETERQAMRDVVARHDARQTELKSRDRGFSWRL